MGIVCLEKFDVVGSRDWVETGDNDGGLELKLEEADFTTLLDRSHIIPMTAGSYVEVLSDEQMDAFAELMWV